MDFACKDLRYNDYQCEVSGSTFSLGWPCSLMKLAGEKSSLLVLGRPPSSLEQTLMSYGTSFPGLLIFGLMAFKLIALGVMLSMVLVCDSL